MARKCEYKGCNYPVFGTDKETGQGFCKAHQWMRGDIQKSIARQKGTTGASEQMMYKQMKHDMKQPQKRREATGEKIVFDMIWNTRKHVSWLSDRPVGAFKNTDMWVNCFAHVIPKNGINQLVFPNKQLKNKLLRLNPENILLLHPDEHILYDNGTEQMRKKYRKDMVRLGYVVHWEDLFEYRNILIEKIRTILTQEQ